MTGLISRIAARAAGATPTAAPRIPSRFEPLPEELGLPEQAAAAPVAYAASPTTATAPPVGPSAHDPAPPLVGAVPAAPDAAPRPATAPVAAAPAAFAPATAPSVAARPTAVVRRREVQAAPAAVASPGPDVSSAAPPTGDVIAAPPTPPRSAEPSGAAATDGPPRPADRARDRIPRPATVAPQPLAAAPNPPPVDAPPFADPSPRLAAPPPPAAPPTPAAPPSPADPTAVPRAVASHSRRREAAPSLNAVSAIEAARSRTGVPAVPPSQSATASLPFAAPPPPVVEIHIGSVEIRAAATPAAPAPRSGPAPMSLDAFLAQGKGP